MDESASTEVAFRRAPELLADVRLPRPGTLRRLLAPVDIVRSLWFAIFGPGLLSEMFISHSSLATIVLII